MPSLNNSAAVSTEIASVARRYRRVERTASWLVALLVVAVVLTAIRTLDLFPAALVAVGIVVLARIPLVTRNGHTRLITDSEPAAVVDAFRCGTPPILAFQWAVADTIELGGEDVDAEESGSPATTRATYAFSYLFGLQSVSMTLEVRSLRREGDDRAATGGAGPATDADVVETLEVSATAGGRPWGTYRVTIRESDFGTVVDVDLTTDRRFDLRSVPQALVAERYFDAILSAQGYRVADRSVSWST
ncbi:hypothetical protein [Halorubrum laminariae]|uniref:SRPBCC family protein n=1 Tax=Halorubrum laminariae TaxID=1433523 RepID=A0ABD6C1Y7_9EURY|nr:hypothetical protein [Halorubrum laminariae]